MKKIKYTYWREGDFYIGFINQYPDYQTQASSQDELKENLVDLWQDLEAELIPYSRQVDLLEVA